MSEEGSTYMARSDYGAFVYCNGKRRKDKEDAPLFVPDNDWPDEGTFDLQKWSALVHGVLGDGGIRVACYKQGLPSIFEWEVAALEPQEVFFQDDAPDPYNYEPFDFEYKGYRFHFEAGAEDDSGRTASFVASMIEPNGTLWECTYDYGYGAGFPEDELDEAGYYIPYKRHGDDD